MNTTDYTLIELIQEQERRDRRNRFLTLFADKFKYPKHNMFFNMGSKYRQRLFLAGNRVGGRSPS